jgi:hypothetical protein
VSGSEFPVPSRGLRSPGEARAKARWSLAVLIGVAALGLVELALQLHFSRAAPRPEVWTQIRPVVKRLAADNALIVVAPRWAEPNARFAFGDELMPLRQVARADDSGFAAALEISVFGQSASELQGWQLETSERDGPFLLRRWKNSSFEPTLYDFLEHAQPASLQVELADREAHRPCPYGKAKVSNGDLQGHPTYPSRRFQCPGGESQFVGATVVEDQDYLPRQCLWAHPPPQGELVLHFEDVPMGAKIRGYGGMSYYEEREQHGGLIRLEVIVGTESVGDYRHADREGWKRFEFPTERFQGQRLPVEFRISAGRVWDRTFCLQAEVR